MGQRFLNDDFVLENSYPDDDLEVSEMPPISRIRKKKKKKKKIKKSTKRIAIKRKRSRIKKSIALIELDRSSQKIPLRLDQKIRRMALLEDECPSDNKEQPTTSLAIFDLDLLISAQANLMDYSSKINKGLDNQEIVIDDSDDASSPLSIHLPPLPPPPPPPPPISSTKLTTPCGIQQHLFLVPPPPPPPIHSSSYCEPSPMDIEEDTDEVLNKAKHLENVLSPCANLQKKSIELKKGRRSKSVQLADDLMKKALKPYFIRRKITKEEYKEIMKRGVAKLKSQESLRAEKVDKFVQKYVHTIRKQRIIK